MEETWFDVSVTRCPYCKRSYMEASWFVMSLESDLECGKCRRSFNSKKYATDRVMLKFKLNQRGEVKDVEVSEHLKG